MLRLMCRCVRCPSASLIRTGRSGSSDRCLPKFLMWFDVFVRFGETIHQVGFEAGTLTQHLTYGLREAGYDVVCMEARQVSAALSAMRNKTDKHDARGIAQTAPFGLVQPGSCEEHREPLHAGAAGKPQGHTAPVHRSGERSPRAFEDLRCEAADAALEGRLRCRSKDRYRRRSCA